MEANNWNDTDWNGRIESCASNSGTGCANGTISSVNVSSTDDDYVTNFLYTFREIALTIMVAFCFISIVENCWILVCVKFLKRSMSPTLCYSISLAAADAYVSLVIGAGLIINSLLPMYGIIDENNYLCLILALEGFRVGAMITSVLHLLGLAINHYIGIVKPLHYQSIMTRFNTCLTIALTWLLPLVFCMVYFSVIKDEGFQSENCAKFEFLLVRKFRYIVASLFFLPLLVMVFIYAHILVIIRRHRRGVLQYQQTEQTKAQMKSNIKAVVTTLLILGTYLLGWIPAVMIFIVICNDCAQPLSIYGKHPILLTVLTAAFNSLIIAKSCIDPIVYAARITEIKEALRRMRYQLCRVGEPPQFFSTQATMPTCTTSVRGSQKVTNRTHYSPVGSRTDCGTYTGMINSPKNKTAKSTKKNAKNINYV